MTARVVRSAVSSPNGCSGRRPRSVQVERIRRQATAAVRANLAVEWLSFVLYGVKTQRPKGASEVTGRAAALMAVTADWRSGRRARPGKFFSASALDCSERTIQRHWRIIERLGTARVTARGAWLSTARRTEIMASPDEQDRWRDRQEWALLLPAWAADLGPEDLELLQKCADEAVELLRELRTVVEHRTRRNEPPGRTGPTAPDRPKGPRPNPQPVSHRPLETADAPFRVSPSVVGFSMSFCSALRGVVLRRPTGRKQQTGAPPAHSPRKNGSGRRSSGAGRRQPREAVVLARELIARGRLPWLVRSPRPMLVQALRPFAAAGWTAHDLERAAQARLDADSYSPPGRIERPVKYLLWLLSDADLTMPPAQVRAEEAEREKAKRHAQIAAARKAADAREAAAAQAQGGGGHQAFRAALAALGGRSGQRRAAERRAEAIERGKMRVRARAGHPLQLPAAEQNTDRLCAGGCGTLSPEVLIRTALPRRTPLCDCCWEQIRPLWS